MSGGISQAHQSQSVETGIQSGQTSKVQRGLRVMAIACAALSLIPPLRLPSALAAHSLILLSTSLSCTQRADSKWGRFVQFSRVGISALGIVAIGAGLPVLIAASLTADIGIQAISAFKAAANGKKNEALMHVAIIVIDALALAGILAGSWQLMVAAAAISAFVMVLFAIKVGRQIKNRTDYDGIIDALSYAALAGVGIASAATTARIATERPTKAHFSLHNRSSHTQTYRGDHGKTIIVLAPGEKADVTVPYKDLYSFHGPGFTKEGLDIQERTLMSAVSPNSIDYDITVHQFPLEPHFFPMAPVANAGLNRLPV